MSADIRKTNVPDIRFEYRTELLREEMAFISTHASAQL